MSAAPPAQSLYAKPLQLSVIVLAWLVIAHMAGLALGGLLRAPAWIALTGTAVATLLLLLPNQTPAPSWRIFPGTVLAVLSCVWLYSAAVHGILPFGLWPGGPATADHWLLLALLVLLAAILACFIEHSSDWQSYAEPVFWGAWLVYGWTLLGAFAQFAGPWTLYLSGSLMVSIIALFPLSRLLTMADPVRGTGVALLATLLVASLPGRERLPYWGTSIAIGWAYGLWLLGNLVLPRWNARFPSWRMAHDAWPWLGLLVLGLGLALMGWIAVLNWAVMLALSAYLLLLLRHSAWPGFAWLGILTLTWVGVAAGGAAHDLKSPAALMSESLTGLAIIILAWANLLLLAVPWWERWGERIAVWLDWRFAGLRIPLLTGAFSLIVFWLLVLLAWDLLGLMIPVREPMAVYLGGLVSVSLLHGCYRWRVPLAAHGLVLAVFGTLLAGWEWRQPVSLPLFLALWGLALIGSIVLLAPRKAELPQWFGQSLVPWASFSPCLTLLALLLTAATALERLLALIVLTVHAAWLGWQRRRQSWWLFAIVLLVALLHAVWLLWLPVYRFPAALPWTALELAALLWLPFQLKVAADRRKDEHLSTSAMEPLRSALEQAAPWIGVLAVVEWVGHGAEFAFTLTAGLPPQPLLGDWDNVVALAGAALLSAVGIGQARRSDDPHWVYGVALLASLAGIYLRLCWVGLAPLSVWDTAAIMGAAYGLFILQRFTRSQPVLKLVLILPLLALLTVPWQLGSDQAALTLLTAATLYLLARRTTGLETPLYLGLLMLNGGIYLWTPEWAGRTGLFQVYLLPAIVTVLLLLHLHRHELKPAVLNSARLAALSTLYAAATLDVFLRPELGVFVVALVLSLVGIVLGIGLRIRAFLYSGIAFLLLNVIGQFIKLYPEQRLGRALVLMALGVVIIGLMIGFNSKREAVLQRIRVFRADLAQWE
ncbi:MAG: hypothetical protein U1F76_13970 [Candidatus Competibacteraceae bacterium]